ncbi:MAG: hypothetical protein IPL30_10935 [Elusimicrobia bacterium]|nr:hypothetical protein [Elusimicrobiota bacterium]
MSQNEAILWRLKRGDVLTPIDALNDPEIRSMRLAARIGELLDMGYDIRKANQKTETGKTVTAYYMPPKEKNGQLGMGF